MCVYLSIPIAVNRTTTRLRELSRYRKERPVIFEAKWQLVPREGSLVIYLPISLFPFLSFSSRLLRRLSPSLSVFPLSRSASTRDSRTLGYSVFDKRANTGGCKYFPRINYSWDVPAAVSPTILICLSHSRTLAPCAACLRFPFLPQHLCFPLVSCSVCNFASYMCTFLSASSIFGQQAKHKTWPYSAKYVLCTE